MSPQDPLANLQPLRQPELIGWWPLAPGWWVLIIAFLILVAALAYWLYQRRRNNAYRRRALQQLQSLQEQYADSDNTGDYLSRINALLKRVALIAYPGHDIAARHGESWREFLNQSATSGEPFQAGFDQAVYQKSAPDVDMAQVHRAARHWIAHHRVTP